MTEIRTSDRHFEAKNTDTSNAFYEYFCKIGRNLANQIGGRNKEEKNSRRRTP